MTSKDFKHKFDWARLFISLCFGLLLINCQAATNATNLTTNTPAVSEDQGASAIDGDNVGTIINKPKPPALEIYPDFLKTIPSEMLADESGYPEQIPPLASASSGNKNHIKDLIRVAHASNQMRLQNLQDFGHSLQIAMATAEIDYTSHAEQSFVFNNPTKLLDSVGKWNVEMAPDAINTDYIRFYFRNPNDGLIYGTYLVKFDSEGHAVRGIMGYVNLSLLSQPTGIGDRLFLLAYDVTNPEQKYVVIRRDMAKMDHPSIVAESHEQCNVLTGECIAEYKRVENQPPLHDAKPSIRITWNDKAQTFCAQLSSTDSTGNAVFSTREKNNCPISEPIWGQAPLSESDMILGYFDTTPPGGDAASFGLDGLSYAGWTSLTAELIDSWIE